MRQLRLVLALLSWTLPTWSLTCSDVEQTGEYLDLELVSVTVDGAPMTDLTAYAPYDIDITSFVDPYGAKSVTRYITFDASRRAVQGDRYFETYPVDAQLSDLR